MSTQWILDLQSLYDDPRITALATTLNGLLIRQNALLLRIQNMQLVTDFDNETYFSAANALVNGIPTQLDGFEDDINDYKDHTPWTQRSGTMPFVFPCDLSFTSDTQGVEFADGRRIETDLSGDVEGLLGNYSLATNPTYHNPYGYGYPFENRLSYLETATAGLSASNKNILVLDDAFRFVCPSAVFTSLQHNGATATEWNATNVQGWQSARLAVNEMVAKTSAIDVSIVEFDIGDDLYSSTTSMLLPKLFLPHLRLIAHNSQTNPLLAFADTSVQTSSDHSAHLSLHAEKVFALFTRNGNTLRFGSSAAEVLTRFIITTAAEVPTCTVNHVIFTAPGLDPNAQYEPFLNPPPEFPVVTFEGVDVISIPGLQLQSLTIEDRDAVDGLFSVANYNNDWVNNNTLFHTTETRDLDTLAQTVARFQVVDGVPTLNVIAFENYHNSIHQIFLISPNTGHATFHIQRTPEDIMGKLRSPNHVNIRPSPRLIAPYTLQLGFPTPDPNPATPWKEKFFVPNHYQGTVSSTFAPGYPLDVGWGNIPLSNREASQRLHTGYNFGSFNIRNNWVATPQGYGDGYMDGRANDDYGCVNREQFLSTEFTENRREKSWPSYMDEFRADFFNFLTLGPGIYQFQYYAAMEIFDFSSETTLFKRHRTSINCSHVAVALRKPDHSLIKWIGLYGDPMLARSFTEQVEIPFLGGVDYVYNMLSETVNQGGSDQIIDKCGIPNSPWGNRDAPPPFIFEVNQSSWYISIHILRAVSHEKYQERNPNERTFTELGAGFNAQASCIRLRYPYDSTGTEELFPSTETDTW